VPAKTDLTQTGSVFQHILKQKPWRLNLRNKFTWPKI